MQRQPLSHAARMIEFQNVSCSYGPLLAVDGVSLHIERGEFVVLIGASGSGKSTMLKMINRMERHDTGKILLNGREIDEFKVRELRLGMGYAIQSVGLFPHWSVERNIGTVPRMMGWSHQKIAARVTALLDLFAMDPATYRSRMPHQLSGGQQQRVGVARALAADPDVLLMDEPFGALDPVIRASLQLEMKRVHRSSKKTIVMVTHDIDEALLLGTKIVLLDHGKLVQVGTPQELLCEPVCDFVMDFLGRNDIGIKLLSLQSAADFARIEDFQPGPALPADATLREAASLMVARGVAHVNVVGESGSHCGVLHAIDLFDRTGYGDQHVG